ncbi:MAG: hypothetical protein ACKVKI_00290 [Flavobacteriales bacterium]|jgi:hypothetical protein
MKNNRLSHLFLFCVASSLVLIQFGCGENKTQIELNKALEVVETISEKLDEFPMDSIANVQDRLSAAKDDIRWLGIDSNVVFVRADVKVIEGLSKASRFLKDASSRYKGLMNETDRCQKQLYSLREVIETGANRDALGDTIDDEYIVKNARLEIEAVATLGELVDESIRLIRLGLEADSAGWEAIDSLLMAKKGEWARGVSGNETEKGL